MFKVDLKAVFFLSFGHKFYIYSVKTFNYVDRLNVYVM